MGADRKVSTLWWGGAPERGHRAPLEPLTQLGDALRGVGALAVNIEATEFVVGQAAKRKRSLCQKDVCQQALTERQTLGSWFERQAANSSDCSVELPLRPSARAAPPLGPRSLPCRLRAWERQVLRSVNH